MQTTPNQLLLEQAREIHWENFPGPSDYVPASVIPAIRALLTANDSTADSVYNQLLSAVGNNHAGIRYPASDALAPIVLACALSDEGWASWAAFEVLIDLCGFDPQGFTGEATDICDFVLQRELSLVAFAKDSAHPADLRAAAIELLDSSFSDKPMITPALQASIQAGPRLHPLLPDPTNRVNSVLARRK